ncbi:MAG: alanine racemase [Acidimicrobiales bacterium]
MRPTWADVDLAAVAHNVELIKKQVEPAAVCAVVKADGYGHGAVPVGRAAVGAGAEWLAVALVEEGKVLRDAGIRTPVLVLSEPRPLEMVEVVAYELTPTVYSGEGLAAAAAAASQASKRLDVHLKVDTGMGRVGAAVEDAVRLSSAIVDKEPLDLAAIWTHCAIADQPGDPYTERQLDTYQTVLDAVAAAGIEVPMRHAANSAVAMAHPRGHYDMVRAGIAVYGLAPSPELSDMLDLAPVMTVRSQVSFVKRLAAGARLSYGLEWCTPVATTIATVPIGYADGVRRSSGRVGGQVLIGGKRYPIVGTVTMDQLMVDCGDDDVVAGDEVVLIGAQGGETIGADEIAAKLGTISYEVVCDIESRVSRRYL